MTTAKQQPATTQGELADDLIAELSKLMAQGNGEAEASPVPPRPETRPVAPEREAPVVQAATPGFKFRLPGDPADPAPARQTPPREPPQASVPTFDVRTLEPATSAVPVLPRVGTPTRFSLSNSPSARPTPAQAAEDEADPIADLIAAELAAQTADFSRPEPSPAPAARVEERPVEPARPDPFPVAPVFGIAPQRRPVDPAPPRSEPGLSAREEVSAEPVQPRFERAAPAEAAAVVPDKQALDELESLIGGAVRAQADHGAQPRPEPSPALRSLATPVARKPEPSVQPSQPTSAEDAILAAAAATGAQVSWIDPDEDDSAYTAAAAAPARPRRQGRGWARQLIGPGVALAFLAVAGVGLYTVVGSGGSDEPAPLLTAEATPTKEVPETTAESEPAQQSVVFNEIAGTGEPAENEQIVSRDQSAPGDITTAAVDSMSEEGVVNRRVRTVTVRPDGTIVGGDTALAGASALPVDRPQVPQVPGAEAASDLPASASAFADPAETTIADLVASDGDAATASPTATTGTDSTVTASLNLDGTATGTATGNPGDATLETALLVPGQPAEALNSSGEVIEGRTVPVPLARIDRPSAPSQVTSTATAPINAIVDTPATTRTPIVADLGQGQQQATAPAAPAATTASPAAAYVQLASQRSEQAAQQTATEIQNRFGGLFNGTSLEVQRVDLGERGIYFRVRLPAQSLQSATQICNSVKANGGDCFPV
jgi:hypothetical protein